MPNVTLYRYYVHADFVISFTFQHPCDKKKVMWLNRLIRISITLLVPSTCWSSKATHGDNKRDAPDVTI